MEPQSNPVLLWQAREVDTGESSIPNPWKNENTQQTRPMKSPKAEFQLNKPLVSRHDKMVEEEENLRTMNTALLEMLFLQMAPDPNSAAQHSYRLDGAKQFITIWQNLGKIDLVEPPKSQSLHYGQ
jgi:hypothetical protein